MNSYIENKPCSDCTRDKHINSYSCLRL